MAIPIIAIIGRPNVGKSTLFNRLLRKRQAIVEDTPGVTRDRHYGEAEWDGRRFVIVDTGGFVLEPSDAMFKIMREQAEIAMDESDIILFLFDGREGLTPVDEDIVRYLRKVKKRIFYVVNKVDGPKQELAVADFYRIGVDSLYPVSAEHGRGVNDLVEDMLESLPTEEDEEPKEAGESISIAVVGKPNVGKSTLINKLLGEKRLLESDQPGTTRDSIDTFLVHEGTKFRIIDTAGIRRKRSVKIRIEKFAIIKALKSISRADVVLLLVDATEGLTDQDVKIASMIQEKNRAAIILVNKWDLMEKGEETADAFKKRVYEDYPYLAHIPILFISALTGRRVHLILKHVEEAFIEFDRTVPTSLLNRFFEEILSYHQPPGYKNRTVKIYFVAQVRSRPPTFVATTNYPNGIRESYQRFVKNQLRKRFGFKGSPIEVYYRRKGSTFRGPRKASESEWDESE